MPETYDTPAYRQAVANGKARMAAFRRAESAKTAHDYGKHRNNPTVECVYCLGEVTYSLHRFSDRYFPEDEIPAGFRR